MGGADCCLVIGEDLLQDVQPDGLQGLLDHLRLEPGGQAPAVLLLALRGCAAVGPLASSARPGDPVGCLSVKEEFEATIAGQWWRGSRELPSTIWCG